jgi:hypothetical protein
MKASAASDVTISALTAGLTTVSGTSGASDAITFAGTSSSDTIDISDITFTDVIATIDGGSGNDTITLSSATDTVIFKDTATNNGKDTINSFTTGDSGDILNMDAFLDASDMNLYKSNPDSATNVTGDVTLLVDEDSSKDDITTADGLKAALADGGEYDNIDIDNSSKAIFVTASSEDTTDQHIFYATTDDSGALTVTEVGVIASVDIDDFTSSNFNI